MAQPLLMSVSFEYLSNTVEEVTQDNFQFHFMGSEMVVAGKLRPQSPAVLSAKVSGQGVSKEASTCGSLHHCSQSSFSGNTGRGPA